MQLARAVNRKAGRGEILRYGLVTDVDVSSLTVQVGGETVAGLPWLDSYTPTEGDRVAILSSRSSLLVLGKVTTIASGYDEPRTERIRPTHWTARSRVILGESWDGHPAEMDEEAAWAGGAYDVWGPVPEDGFLEWYQGLAYPPRGDDLPNYHPGLMWTCMGVRYPDLSQVLPADAEVLSIGVRLKHADWRYVLTQANPRPVLHGLDIDLGEEYDDFPAGPNDPPFPAVSGFEDLIADPIPVGTASTFMLPDAWVEALVAGDITGLLAWSPLEENSIVFDAYGCWDLYVTYVTPIET